MDTILQFFHENIYWIKLISIPFVAGFIGWLTNWQAIKMTFEPLDFKGIKIGPIPLGWQGIIPANRLKMAEISVKLMTEKLISVEDIFEKLDPDDIAKEISPQTQALAEEVVSEAMMKYQPAIWKNTPQVLKNQIFSSAAKDIPGAVRDMMEDLKTNIHSYMDLETLCKDALIKDKTLVNEIFLNCGEQEFKFIERSGWYFGFLFGIPQMILWHFYPEDWMLPAAGVIVGYFTNFLALKLIFNPLKPIKIFGFTFIGLFIKRQNEVSAEYGKIIADRVLYSENLWEHMLNRQGGKAMYDLIEKHVNQSLNQATGSVPQPILTMLEGSKVYSDLREMIVKNMVARLPNKFKYLHDFTDATFDIEGTLREKLQELPPKDFVGVLRPAFESEELKLILVGAALGGIAGFLQWAFVFGGLG
ncbi:MAG: DUF445 family protein [Chitinophagales bacterium]|nr:DUF445 family protein [Chitinophagales bacterium]